MVNSATCKVSQPRNNNVHISSPVNLYVDPIATRDTAVLEDPLYPPLGRMPRPLADQYLQYKQERMMTVSSKSTQDTFQLMAYLISSVDRSEKWNVYGRQKYRGSSQGDFYAIQQCNSTSQCTKIDLTNDIIKNNQLRDFYNLPSSVMITSPLFSTSSYDIVQLKTTMDNSQYY